MQPDSTHAAGDRGHLAAITVAALVGLALVAVMVTRTSQAAFSASTANTGNYFNGGTVTLQDNNDASAALFTIDAMDPGESYTSCIDVEYVGSITSPSDVVVYSGTAPTESSALGDHIQLTIERGTSSSTGFGDCTGFASEATPYSAVTLSDFYTTNVDYASGLGTWIPATTPETRTYQITATLLDTVPDTEEGATVSDVEFVWEIQS